MSERLKVSITCGLLKRDFWAEGRTRENLGLDGLGVPEIISMVEGR